MMDRYSISDLSVFFLSDKFLLFVLLLNIILTTFLIFQNFKKNAGYKNAIQTSKSNAVILSDNVNSPFSEAELTRLDQKQEPNFDNLKIERAIKMIQNNCPLQDIKSSLDIEPAYLTILLKSYKG